MKIHLCGAAGEVTGSGYLVDTGAARVLIDFGLFQGRAGVRERNAALGPVDPARLDAIVLTHGHLDHCGRLPLLTRNGFNAPIHATAATIDFADLILSDSAHLQAADALRQTRRRQRAGRPAVEPLYRQEHVEALRPLYRPLPYREAREVAAGVSVRLQDAGHMLGSASVEMTVTAPGVRRTLVFSGDLGRPGTPLLRDPEPFRHADFVFLESTYGDRDHRSFAATVEEFHAILVDAGRTNARVLIPAFAVGRTQQLLYHLAELRARDGVPKLPIYIDSPMAIRATELYCKHQDLLDAEGPTLGCPGRLLRNLRDVHPLLTADESRQLNESSEPSLVIAASGMCDGGRILHHLKHHLWRPNVWVIFVGYQADGTLGRRLVDGAKRVRIHGEEVVVRAHKATLGGFSGHAGQSQLLDWYGALGRPPVALTHGEDRQRGVLREVLRARCGVEARLPRQFDVLDLS